MAQLKDQLKKDLTESIKAQNAVVSGTLRMALTAVTNEEVSGKESRELTDAETLADEVHQAEPRRGKFSGGQRRTGHGQELPDFRAGGRNQTIIPAATVSCVPGSTRTKEPVRRLRR